MEQEIKTKALNYWLLLCAVLFFYLAHISNSECGCTTSEYALTEAKRGLGRQLTFSSRIIGLSVCFREERSNRL